MVTPGRGSHVVGVGTWAPVLHTDGMPRMPFRTRALATLMRRGIFPSIATMDLSLIHISEPTRPY